MRPYQKYILILSNFPWMQAYLRDDMLDTEISEKKNQDETKKDTEK